MEKDNSIKKFIDKINSMSGKYSRWEILNDLVTMYAISLANTCDRKRAEEREKEYLRIVAKYTKAELDDFTSLAAMVIVALEENPDQDFLGDVYMRLRIADKVRGQYFTPYPMSRCMAQIVWNGDSTEEDTIINEPACGSGVNLITIANTMKDHNFNYQQKAYFVAQDIDPLVAKMCYIQISLLGCPGVVIIGDTLLGKFEEKDYWYTPFHFIYGMGILRRRKQKSEEESERKKEEEQKEDDWLLKAVGII